MSILDRFKNGLKKTRDFVSSGFTRIAAHMGRFDEEMLEELEMLLIQADCGVDAVERLMNTVREGIRKSGDNRSEAVLESLRSGMLEILGEKKRLELAVGNLNVVLMVGVNGTGKTTTAGKLAWRYQQEGKKVLLAAADTFRAAAIEQLKVWGQRSGCPVIANASGSDPAAVCYDAAQAARSRGADLLIVDTAGRLHNKQNLMDELGKIRRVLRRELPDAKMISLLTIDATTGQNALFQARAFHEVTELDGLILSKLDGNAKGGIALALAEESRLPVLLVGLGEAIEDLQDFDSQLFVDSLLPKA